MLRPWQGQPWQSEARNGADMVGRGMAAILALIPIVLFVVWLFKRGLPHNGFEPVVAEEESWIGI